ncbi:unnamed protein product [Blepharisma stoltei]|uniref:Uncharacterized protein n=1 Tax=Blepharisma stoltei TaxID=1481888 RepID=A0AAU9K0C8_9CILI|nr:unnamed protein product [Blepharisma stoltei]
MKLCLKEDLGFLYKGKVLEWRDRGENLIMLVAKEDEQQILAEKGRWLWNDEAYFKYRPIMLMGCRIIDITDSGSK